MISQRFLSFEEFKTRNKVISNEELDELLVDLEKQEEAGPSSQNPSEIKNDPYDDFKARFVDSYSPSKSPVRYTKHLDSFFYNIQQSMQISGIPYVLTHCFDFTHCLKREDVFVLKSDYSQIDFTVSAGVVSGRLSVLYMNQPTKFLQHICQCSEKDFRDILIEFVCASFAAIECKKAKEEKCLQVGKNHNVSSFTLDYFLSELFDLSKLGSFINNQKEGEFIDTKLYLIQDTE